MQLGRLLGSKGTRCWPLCQGEVWWWGRSNAEVLVWKSVWYEHVCMTKYHPSFPARSFIGPHGVNRAPCVTVGQASANELSFLYTGTVKVGCCRKLVIHRVLFLCRHVLLVSLENFETMMRFPLAINIRVGLR